MNRRVLGVIVGVAIVGVAVALLFARGHSAGKTAGAGSTANAGAQRAPANGVASPRGALRGHVTDARGPLAGATVCAATRYDQQTCATTDAQGAFTLGNLPATAYRLTALAAQHRPATFGFGTPAGTWLVLGPGETRDRIDFVLRAGVVLTGVVQDINGGPIAGARVRVQTDGGFDMMGEARRFWSPPVVSGKDGTFQQWVAPGDVTVTAAADGYGESSVDANAPTSVVILLTPEGSIVGTVVDEAGQPVPDAAVYASSLDMTRETLSAADGSFTLDGLTAAEFWVRASTARGYGTIGRVAVSLGKQTSVKIRLLTAARLSGVVMLGDKPCPEPHVEVRDPRTQVERAMVDDGGGRVHLDGVLAGEYVVHPSCPGGYEAPAPYARVVMTDKDQDGLVWRVLPGASLRGRVTDEGGTPLADVEVQAEGESRGRDHTGDDGTYEITGLRAGSYTITATALDGGQSEGMVTLGDGESKLFDLEVEASARIAGTLVDAAGRPVAGLEIRADPRDQKRSKGTSMSAPEVSTTGAFDIAVKPGAYHVYAAVDWSHPIAPGVDVTVSRGQRVNVQIKVPAQDGTIKGKVVDARGEPVNDAVVTASIPDGMFGAGFTLAWNEHPVLTAVDGTFTVKGLGPGEYTVSAQRPGAPVAEQKGVSPGSTVTLTITSPTSIAGTVAYPDGKHPREMLVAVRDTAQTFFRQEEILGSNGAFSLEEIVAGPLTLTVTDPDRGFVAVKLALAPGEAKKDLALVLQPMVEIHGRLVDATTKKPLAGQIVLAKSVDAVVNAPSYFDDFNHTTAADGTFRIAAPLGRIAVSSNRFSIPDHERCSGSLETTISGPADVGDLELVCKGL